MSDELQKAIFKENLNRILSERQKTQREVADAIGVSPQTFNTWCQGIALPRMGKLQKLADYFMLNKSDLIEEHTASSPAALPQLSPEAQLIGEAYDCADEGRKDAVATLLDVKRDVRPALAASA